LEYCEKENINLDLYDDKDRSVGNSTINVLNSIERNSSPTGFNNSSHKSSIDYKKCKFLI
jgi:hypothetical protein